MEQRRYALGFSRRDLLGRRVDDLAAVHFRQSAQGRFRSPVHGDHAVRAKNRVLNERAPVIVIRPAPEHAAGRLVAILNSLPRSSRRVRTPDSPWYTGVRSPARSRSLSFRASTRSFLLPAFSKAFFRGSHTITLVTCGFNRSYNQAALVPSSKVIHKLPCMPRMNARMVAAFVSIMDSTISFPAASLTATEMLA